MSETLQIVALDKIVESKTNPRRHFDEKGLKELAESIKAKGLITRILVRPQNGKFEIVAGARRFRATKLAGLHDIPVEVRELSDEDALEVQVIENLQREDVHPLDEAIGYEQLMKKNKYDVETIAVKVGKSASYVYQRLKLADLIEPAKKAFFENEITAGHAILVARLQPKDQEKAVKEMFITRWQVPGRIVISVRELTKWIEQNIHLDLHSVPFPKDVNIAKVGPCTTCPKRSGFNQDLFNDITKKDVCTDPTCFKGKLSAFYEVRQKDAKEKFGKEAIYVSGHKNSWETRKSLATRDQWKEVSKNNRCDHAKAAVIAEGDGAGRILEVCTEQQKCRKHFPQKPHSGNARRESPAEIKKHLARDRQIAIGEIVERDIRSLLPKYVPGEIKMPELRILIDILAATSNSNVRDCQSALGLNRVNLTTLSGMQLCRVLNLLMLDEEFTGWRNVDLLTTTAKRWGINVNKVKKQAEERSKWKCEMCSCTELKACEEGCSWDPQFAKVKRHVCTSCVKEGKTSLQTSAKPKPTTKKKKGGKK